MFLRKRWVDIIVYGGAAGGGKSYALLLDAAWHAVFKPVKDYGAVIFRRTSPQITQPGGLWETSLKLYPLMGGKPRKNPWLGWEWAQFETSVRFSHMQYEENREDWQGSQLDWCGFDELTHFTEGQFFYMLSRLRHAGDGGIKPILRATTNPDPDSWVRTFLAPWVDDEYPDPAKSGEVRWFYRDGDTIVWLHSPQERPDFVEHDDVHSVTFIESHLEDNPALMASDPGYRGRIRAMPLVDRIILAGGPQAWKVRREGNMFKRPWFEVVDAIPADLVAQVRRWDLAGTEPQKGKNDPDWTCGVKMGRTVGGVYYVLDAVFLQGTPGEVKRVVKQTAELDGRSVPVRVPQDPGQAGKGQAHDFVASLDGWDVAGVLESGDKVTRAKPFSAQCEVGNVKLVRGPWVEQWLNQICAFPNKIVHDDAVDASDGAHDYLSNPTPAPNIRFFRWDDDDEDEG